MAVQQTRTYPVVYGGWIGGLLAGLLLVACLVLWLTGKIDVQTAVLIGGTDLAILLR
jgi:hypothetical protein